MYCRADNYRNWTALRSLASLNPIDPSRILKDVEREELEALRELLSYARAAAHEVEDNGECDMSAICDAVLACDALRSSTNHDAQEARGR